MKMLFKEEAMGEEGGGALCKLLTTEDAVTLLCCGSYRRLGGRRVRKNNL